MSCLPNIAMNLCLVVDWVFVFLLDFRSPKFDRSSSCDPSEGGR